MPPCAMLPASWKTWVPRERPTPSSPYACAAVGQDHRHGAERQHVVDDGRLAEQAVERGDRRLGPDHAALALEALQHRGLLAADVGAGADPHVQVEAQVASRGRSRPSQPWRVGDLDRGPQRGDRVRVLRADVDVALARRRPRGRRSSMPSISGERVALDQHPVGERAAVALVGVAADELQVVDAVEHGRHLMPAGKPAPPRPRSPESVTSATTSAGDSSSARRSPARPPWAS